MRVAKMYAYWITVNYVKHMECLPVMEFCSIMNHRSEEKPLLPEKLPGQLQELPWAFRINFIWEIWMPKGLGTCQGLYQNDVDDPSGR